VYAYFDAGVPGVDIPSLAMSNLRSPLIDGNAKQCIEFWYYLNGNEKQNDVYNFKIFLMITLFTKEPMLANCQYILAERLEQIYSMISRIQHGKNSQGPKN
jgi:hypothetical protein